MRWKLLKEETWTDVSLQSPKEEHTRNNARKQGGNKMYL